MCSRRLSVLPGLNIPPCPIQGCLNPGRLKTPVVLPPHPRPKGGLGTKGGREGGTGGEGGGGARTSHCGVLEHAGFAFHMLSNVPGPSSHLQC